MWWFLAACTPGPVEQGPASPPPEAAPPPPLDDLLQQAAEKGAVGDADAAVSAWSEAHAAWEAGWEPRVRPACDRCATEIEYTFGRLRAEIEANGGRPQPVLVELRQRLERWAPAE